MTVQQPPVVTTVCNAGCVSAGAVLRLRPARAVIGVVLEEHAHTTGTGPPCRQRHGAADLPTVLERSPLPAARRSW